MVRSVWQGLFLAAIACAALVAGEWGRVQAAQPPWTGDGQDVQRCTSTSGGPQNLESAFVFFGTSGPGALVNGEYISFTCNFKFTRNGTGYTAGVSVIVDYCPTQDPSGPTEQPGTYNTDSGVFSFRFQQKLLHQGALITITLFTNKHNGVPDFNLQEMISGSTNLADLNRPQGACGGGGSGNWAISLGASQTNLVAGNDFTLTATANKTTAGTNYRIFIRNLTEQTQAACPAVAVCTAQDFKNEPGTKVYQAVIANAQGQDVQASSAQVTVTWSEWSGSVTLVAEKDEVDAGEVAYMNATASPTINATVYKIRVERLDGGALVEECLESPCRAGDVFESAGKYKFVAHVLRQDGTNVRASSPPIEITWKATEDWNGTVHVLLAGGRDLVRIGVPVVIEAQASPDLTGTDYVLTIFEEAQGGQGATATCDNILGERCKLVVVENEKTTRFFRAMVLKRDGSEPAKAVSEALVTVSWTEDGPAQACEDGWRAKTIEGEAFVLIGGTLKQPLKPGQWICPRDTVETSANSKIVGEFAERGLFNPNTGYVGKIEVAPNTRLELDFTSQSIIHSIFHIDTGKAAFVVDGPRKSDFRIKSPTSVASVRGTEFSVDVDPITGHTYFEVYHGEVLVEPDNPDLDDVVLKPGDSVTVGEDDITDVAKFYGALAHKRRLPALTRDGSN